MVGSEIILKYFPEISSHQMEKFCALGSIYEEWNQRLNLISRKDIANLYERHVLHSLAIAKWIEFVPESRIMDLGSGGGFPGIPLAVFFPDVSFHLVDSIFKKSRAIREIAEALELKNVKAVHGRAEEQKDKYDFVVCRAVAETEKLVKWTRNRISTRHKNVYPNGLISLKGSKITEEIREIRKQEYLEITPLDKYFDEVFFKEKCLVYIQLA